MKHDRYTLTVSDGKKEYSLFFTGAPTLQQVLEENGMSVPHPCGGRGSCGKCAVRIEGEISAPDEREEAFGCRLSCRTRLYGNAKAWLENNGRMQAEGAQKDILLGSGEVRETGIGAAVDIGTTTVAVSLYDLSTGKCLSTKTMMNPQVMIAADVIGRIAAACNGKSVDLRQMICDCIEKLADQSREKERIKRWCVTGNTTMLYLFSGRNPQALAAAPFLAEHLFGEESVFLGKELYLPACMDAFVGADITCAVLESGMCDSDKTALLCDVGTNGELVLWKNGRLYATSTAAGPVFEGAGISCGCMSMPGAVESVWLTENGLGIRTIENASPVGLCGSGVIDAVACLLENGTIDETGAMEEEKAFICEGIEISQKDIRTVQLAKAAIAAGIRTLLALSDTKEEEIDVFYIAGGFGSHLNLSSAVKIGLFPKELQKKVKVLGNAALKGAALLLAEKTLRKKTQEIAAEAVCINLGGMSEFNERYVDEMFF